MAYLYGTADCNYSEYTGDYVDESFIDPSTGTTYGTTTEETDNT